MRKIIQLIENNTLAIRESPDESAERALIQVESSACLISLPVYLTTAEASGRFTPPHTVTLDKLSNIGIVRSAASAISAISPGDRVASRLEPYTGLFNTQTRRIVKITPTPDASERLVFAGIGAWLNAALRRSRVELGARIGIIGMGVEGCLLLELAAAAGADVAAFDTDRQRLDMIARHGITGEYLSRESPVGIIGRRCGTRLGLDAVFLTGIVADAALWETIISLLRPGGRLVILQQQDIAFSRAVSARPFTADIVTSHVMWDDFAPTEKMSFPVSYVRWSIDRDLNACVDTILQERIFVEWIPVIRLTAGGDEEETLPLKKINGESALILRFPAHTPYASGEHR